MIRKPKNKKRIAALILILVTVLNLVLLVMGAISQLVFWLTAAVIGLIAFKVIPKQQE
jgi:hypothetical protein